MPLPKSSIHIKCGVLNAKGHETRNRSNAPESAVLSRQIVIFDLGNGREGDLYDLAIGCLDLHAGSGERLGGLHAANGPPHSSAVDGNYLDVVLTVKRLQRRECFGYFHRRILPDSNIAS